MSTLPGTAEKPSHAATGCRRSLARFWVFAILAAALFAWVVAPTGLANPLESNRTAARPLSATPSAGDELLAAQASLQRGGGPQAPAHSDPRWTSLNAPLSGTDTMVYDAKDKYVVYFGNNATGTASETWKFLAGNWVPVFPTTSPGPRIYSTMTYDAKDGYVLLFGGYSTGACSCALDDTWSFVGGQWTQRIPTVYPPATYLASMAYDAKDGKVVLFGGYNGTIGDLNSTWTYAGGIWTQLTPHKSPSSREQAALTYDAKDSYVLLFGGYSSDLFANYNDTWKFVGGQWTHLSPVVAPPPREAAGIAYDLKDGYVVLFGGACVQDQPCYPPSIPIYGDTWKFAAGIWTNITPKSSPPPDSDIGLTYDAADGYTLFLGLKSLNGHIFDLTWKFVGGRWTSPFPTPVQRPPTADHGLTYTGRNAAAMAYDAKDGYVVLFGGSASDASSLADTWEFKAGQWTELLPSVSPTARSDAGMVYDAKDGYLLLFGGYSSVTSSGYLSDTWKFVGGTWTQLSPSSSPTARADMGTAYDAKDGYVLLFGGDYFPTGKSEVLDNDTWEFAGGQWTALMPSTHPSARSSPSMTYDANGSFVLLFGGIGTAFLSDTWTFVGGKWTQLSPSVHPSVRGGAAITYDAAIGAVLLYGGVSVKSGVAFIVTDTWTFASGTWSQLTFTTYPRSGGVASLTFDSKLGYAVLFGGNRASGIVSQETWKFA
jgi:galactose oxidase-like protein